MRAERLLKILLLLQARGQLSARGLARELEVSVRTIQRDLDSLSLAGVPVYANRGRSGGWTLAPDYRTRLNGLTPAEARTLFVDTTAHIRTDLGLDSAATSAFAKLLSAVPAHARADAERARQRILVDGANWQGAGAATEWLAVVQDALWQDVLVRIEYGSKPTAFAVAPLGLVAKKYHWYLVAAREDGAIRTYRVSRIRHATRTDESFDRPPDFELSTYWEQSAAAFFAGLRDYPVRLRVRDRALSRLSWAPNAVIEEVTAGPDGWSDVRMTCEKEHEAKAYFLGLAGDIVILEPIELRAAVTEAAAALLEHNR